MLELGMIAVRGWSQEEIGRRSHRASFPPIPLYCRILSVAEASGGVIVAAGGRNVPAKFQVRGSARGLPSERPPD